MGLRARIEAACQKRIWPASTFGAYHRMMSTYVNALVEAGLCLERLCEPRASGRVAERVRDYGEVPAVLLARCRKV